MANKNSGCWNNTTSNCVENVGSHKEFENQTQVNDYVLDTVSDLKAELDFSGLQTGGTKINVLFTLADYLQYFVDYIRQNNTDTIEINGETIQVSVDLKSLAGDCNTGALNLNNALSILTKEIIELRKRVSLLENKLNS